MNFAYANFFFYYGMASGLFSLLYAPNLICLAADWLYNSRVDIG
jgi:hypothetical protein